MGRLRTEVMSCLVKVILLLSLFYLECQSAVNGYPPSVNCKTQECVEYEVVHTQPEFEIRTYKKSVWVASGFITTVSYLAGYGAAYIDVYKFYKGENKGELDWTEKTQPVLTDIIPKTSYDSIYKTYLLVPKDYQNRVPAPRDGQDVTAVTLPPTKFAAVKRFGGYISDKTIAANLAELKKNLKGTQWESAAATLNCTVADYQFQLIDQKDRVNEIVLWFN